MSTANSKSTLVEPLSSPERHALIRNETLMAVKNAMFLTASLFGTLGIAVIVRIWMPRFLGPDAFGVLHFAEEFAAACMFFTTLGVETYIKRDVATRPAHASEFFGGLIITRMAATLVVSLAMAAGLFAMNKSWVEWQLVGLFVLGQMAFTLNTSQASCLQATGNVRELAAINVASKVLWGVGIVAGLALGATLKVVALSFLITEAIKVPALHYVCKKYLKLEIRWAVRPMIAVLGFSMPFFLNHLAHEIYARIGVTMMSAMTNDAEVGLYGAANQIKTLVLLALPIINAVVLPMGSRLARESHSMLADIMTSTIRLVLSLATPVALLIALNAFDIMHFLFRSEYTPATRILQVMMLIIPMACYCTLSAMHLLHLGKIWSVTKISLIGLVVNLVLNPVLIRHGHDLFGDGGAGMGSAVTSLVTELLVAVLLFFALKGGDRDKKLPALLVRLVALSALVSLVHIVLRPLGAWRVPIEVLLILTVGPMLKALPLTEIYARLRAAMQARAT